MYFCFVISIDTKLMGSVEKQYAITYYLLFSSSSGGLNDQLWNKQNAKRAEHAKRAKAFKFLHGSIFQIHRIP